MKTIIVKFQPGQGLLTVHLGPLVTVLPTEGMGGGSPPQPTKKELIPPPGKILPGESPLQNSLLPKVNSIPH